MDTLRAAGEEILAAAMDLYDAVEERRTAPAGLYRGCADLEINRLTTAVANWLRALDREMQR